MLHGVGSNGRDLISLAPLFADDFPDMHFISVDAPEPFQGGGDGFQWFTYWDRSHAQIIEGSEKAATIVSMYVMELCDKYSVEPENVLLLGFSQGAMVSLQTALTMQDNCAGVLAFSGGLLKVEISDFEIRSQPPICLIHGAEDEVVPAGMSQSTAEILQGFNVPVECHILPRLSHSIDMPGIKIAREFMRKAFSAPVE